MAPAASALEDVAVRHSAFAAVRAKDDSQRADGPTTLVLTGATGSLGSHLLCALVKGQVATVDKVICLVRAGDSLAARNRVHAALQEHRLDVAGAEKKIDYVTSLWELSLKKDVVVAARLSVIHCAWIVDRTLPLERFEEDCIAALKDLLDFFRSCTNASRFVFCSSLESIQHASSHPEEWSTSASDAALTGYARSKWVGERVCQHAGKGVMVVRIGRVHGKGSRTAALAPWPALVQAAKLLGSLPDSGPDIDWLPVDVAARAIIEAFASPRPTTPPVIHVALPAKVQRLPWTTFVSWLRDSGLPLTLEPKARWWEQLKGQAAAAQLVTGLSDAADMLVSQTQAVDTTKGVAQSQSLAGVEAVDEEMCRATATAWV